MQTAAIFLTLCFASFQHLRGISAVQPPSAQLESSCNWTTTAVHTKTNIWPSSEDVFTEDCAKTEGMCLIKLISVLRRVEEVIACKVGSLPARNTEPPDIDKLSDTVRKLQQDVEYLKCKLIDASQKLDYPESNKEKLLAVFSHALGSVTMVRFLGNNVSEVFADALGLSDRADLVSAAFDSETLVKNLTKSLVEVQLAISTAEENSVLVMARNFSFIQDVVDGLSLHKSQDAAGILVAIAAAVQQRLMELVGVTKEQDNQLRMLKSLSNFSIQNDKLSQARAQLQGIENLLNRKGQQIVSLIRVINTNRHSLSLATQNLADISEMSGNLLSALESGVTNFESYKNALFRLSVQTSQVVDHTLNLLVHLESIQSIERQHGIPKATDPFSRLNNIADAAREVRKVIAETLLPQELIVSSLQRDLLALTGLNYFLLQSVDTTASTVRDISLKCGDQLARRAGYLQMTLEKLSAAVQHTLSDTIIEVEGKNAELHHQVDELAIFAALVAVRVENTTHTVSTIGVLATALLRNTRKFPEKLLETEGILLDTVSLQFPEIEVRSPLVAKAINESKAGINVTAAQLLITRNHLKLGEAVVNSIWHFLDEVSLPVRFSNGSVLAFERDLASGRTTNEAVHSISFVMRKTECSDCIIVQISELWLLEVPHSQDHSLSLTVGIVNSRVVVRFTYSHPFAGTESVSLTTEGAVNTSEPISVEVSRTDRNVHLFVENGREAMQYSNSSAVSDAVSAFFRGGSPISTTISLGGASDLNQSEPFLRSGNFTGCLSEILLNGESLDVWSLASASPQSRSQMLQPCSSLGVMLRDLRLSCNGSLYARANILRGSLFPLEIRFSTFLRNGLLMYAFNGDVASSILVSVSNGHVEIEMYSGEEKATLTSHRSYSNGANQFFSLSLSQRQDQHILTLQSSLEETRTTLPFTEPPRGALLNYTDLFLCGVPDSLADNTTRDSSNFTGCAALSSRIELAPLPLYCDPSSRDGRCSYCSNEGVLSALFYGASYASFAPVTIDKYFDLDFSFVTAFPNGLLIHSGNSSRGLWFDIVMVDGRVQVLFGSSFGVLSLPTRTRPLNDLVRHTFVLLVTIGSTIDILIDGSNIGSFPFGSFFPAGILTPALSVGGVGPSLEATVLPAVATEGFKGCIENLRILGRSTDLSGSREAEQVNFKSSNGSQSVVDAFLFDGQGYAKYEIGRFELNFDLGLQLRTTRQSALLLYVEAAFALQLLNGEVGLVLAGGEAGGAVAATSNNTNISNGVWHSMMLRALSGGVQLFVDGSVAVEIANAAAQTTGTNSSYLFIGGIPSTLSVSLPDTITRGFKGEMRMPYLEHSIRSDTVQRIAQTT